MADLLDYLDWRGDLTLAQAPFNEVDNLILAELSYIDFRGIVPGPEEGPGVPLWAAADAYFSRFTQGEKIDMGLLLPDQIPEMLDRLAELPRFREMTLSCFVDQVDADRGEQFAALTVETGDRMLYLSFRGTDDTLAGWKEDLELACMPEVPAQKKAVRYAESVARQYPRKKLRLGGHSKGGNLAVYAGVFCGERIQRRIVDIWSNDGPGFQRELLDLPEHRRIAERIHSIVPKSSVVGMLLEHEEAYTVVDSDQLGLLQHDGFSWQVLGDRFVTLRQVTRQAQLSDQALRKWVQGLTVEQRGTFVDALFHVLTASGAETLTDLKEDSFRSAGAILKAMKELDREVREGLWQFLSLLVKSNLRLVLEGLQEETEKRVRRRKKG